MQDPETIEIDQPTRLDRWYGRLAGETTVRSHRGLPRSAARHVPANFLRYLLAHIGTKTADEMMSAKTVLAWLLTAVGAPVALVAWLVPIRESGSMLPQLFVTNRIRVFPYRKRVWVVGGAIQALAVAGIGFAAGGMRGAAAGWTILACLVLFSLARSLTSVAGKDVVGKTIPKQRRGRLNGLSTSVSGVVACLLGLAASFWLKGRDELGWLLVPIGLAAGCWVLATLAFATIREEAGAVTPPKKDRALGAALKLLQTDLPFRRFVIARALMLCSALSAPFYVVLGMAAAEADVFLLGLFILSGGLATGFSAPFWGRRADLSSRRVLIHAATLAGLTGFALCGVLFFHDGLASRPGLYAGAYFCLTVAHSGIRVGRQTYIVDMAEGDQRTEYVAVSNTLIGAILLAAGTLSALAFVVGPVWFILLLSATAMAGAGMAGLLPEAE